MIFCLIHYTKAQRYWPMLTKEVSMRMIYQQTIEDIRIFVVARKQSFVRAMPEQHNTFILCRVPNGMLIYLLL